MEQLTANLSRAKVQRRTVHGREYLVAPITILAPGVLNGSKGALYYPPEEIARNHADWNGIPILVNHSIHNGQSISGRDPAVWERQGVGHVYNSRITRDGRQVVDGYFDVAALRKVNTTVYDRLMRGEPVSVSTGLFTQNEPAKGSDHRGRAYTHVAKGYKPDHLAVLPDQPGACSIEDGCGVLLNQRADNAFCSTGPGGGVDPTCGKGEGGGLHGKEREVDIGEDAHKALSARVSSAAGRRDWKSVPSGFVTEAVNRLKDDLKSYFKGRANNEIKARGALSKASDFDEVQAAVDMLRGHGLGKKIDNLGGRRMTPEQKKEIVDGLISNCDCGWSEEDRETLNGFADEKLTAMDQYRKTSVVNAELVANAKEMMAKEGEEEVCNEDDEECKDKKKMMGEKKEMPMIAANADEWLAKAPESVREAVQEAMQITENARQGLISILTAGLAEGDRQTVTNALKDKPLAELRALQSLAPKRSPASYAGVAGAVANTSARRVEPLRSPDSYAGVN